MSATTHPFAPEEIMAFVDGELSADCFRSVSEHLESCAECRGVRDSFRNVSNALSSWTIQAPLLNAKFEDHISAAALDAPSSLAHSGGLRRHIFPRLPWQLIAATSTLFVLVIVVIGLSTSRYARTMPASSRVAQSEVAPRESSGGRGTLGKLDAYAPAASPIAKSGVRPGDVATSVDFAQVDESKVPAPPPPPPGYAQSFGARLGAPMIARTVSLSIVAKDFEAARTSLDAILARHNGYAAGLNVATPQGTARTLQASLRIPAPQLAAAVAELKALGRVEAETQNGEEVTQQHADLLARLKNSRETEQRLQDVLRTRTGKVKDVLEVEEEIARVRGEIEQMEAEQQTLEHRVSFATIDLKLAEEYKAELTAPAPSVAIQLRNALVDGFRTAFQSLLALVLFFAESGPTLFLWLMILSIPAWLLWRRYQRSLAMGSIAGV